MRCCLCVVANVLFVAVCCVVFLVVCVVVLVCVCVYAWFKGVLLVLLVLRLCFGLCMCLFVYLLMCCLLLFQALCFP